MRADEKTYELIIGRPVYVGEKAVNLGKYANTNEGNAYLINDLHIEFDIKKDNSKDPNKASLTIFNLSDEMVDYLSVNQNESLAVLFKAGYNGDNKLIFQGTVEYVEDMFPEETRRTKLILGDGTLNLTTTMSSRSYRKGTSYNTILNDLVSDLKLPKGRIVDFNADKTTHAMAFTGTASSNLASLAKKTNSTFSVQDGAVFWTKQGSRFSSLMFEISEDGGMIGVPSPKQPNSAKKSKKKVVTKKKSRKPKKEKEHDIREDVGMTVVVRLNGAILPESTVYLNTKRYKGFYKVAELTHNGGFETGNWQTELGLVETRGELIK